MKALWVVILAGLTIACSSHNNKTFVVQDRTGQVIELSNLRYCTGGNLWDTCRGDIEVTITKGSIDLIKLIPRDFEGIQNIEIVEGSGENLSEFTKEVRRREIRILYNERLQIERVENTEKERQKILNQGSRSTNSSQSPTPADEEKSRKEELDKRLIALQDSLAELKIRLTYTSGETAEGIRKRRDWQHEDYIYGTSKDSDKSVRLDIAKVRSIKVKTNE